MEPTGPRPPLISISEPDHKPVEEASPAVTRQTPEPNPNFEKTPLDKDKISPVLKPSLEGLKALQKMTAKELLQVVFDKKTLLNWRHYHLEERRKSEFLVKSWMLLVETVQQQRFLTSGEMKPLLRDFHAVSFTHGADFDSDYAKKIFKPGDFRNIYIKEKRYYKGSIYAPHVEKSRFSHCSEQSLREHSQIMQHLCQSAYLSEFPSYCFREDNTGVYLAVPTDMAVELLRNPPDTEEEIEIFFSKIADSYSMNRATLFPLKMFDFHLYQIVANWEGKQKGTSNSKLASNRRSDHSVRQALDWLTSDIERKGTSCLHYTSFPDESIGGLLKLWAKNTNSQIKSIKTKNDLTSTLVSSSQDLQAIRPFPDGNTRVGVLFVQGLRMTFGQAPLMLDSRYIFNLEQQTMRHILEQGGSTHSMDDFEPNSQQLEAIKPLQKELRALSLED